MRCGECNRDIDSIGQDNCSYTSTPLCEDCAGISRNEKRPMSIYNNPYVSGEKSVLSARITLSSEMSGAYSDIQSHKVITLEERETEQGNAPCYNIIDQNDFSLEANRFT